MLSDAKAFELYVKGVGGPEAFERQMQEVAEKHGGKYGAPNISSCKAITPGRYLEAELGMSNFKPMGPVIDLGYGSLLSPHALIEATVNIPEDFRSVLHLTPHSTSTFARCGINLTFWQNTFREQLESFPLPKTMKVIIENWSSIPILMREGDPCRLLNLPDILVSKTDPIMTSPRSKESHGMLHLHAGKDWLIPDMEVLPRVKMHGIEIPYIDPRAGNIKQIFVPTKYDRLKFDLGAFFVLSTKEKFSIPEGCVALVHTARDDLTHTSAILAHGGWEGVLALEFKALRESSIRPGDHVAYFTTHLTGEARKYSGRYQNQDAITPK
jgi:deoxycytidine triphosphate deaminase